MKIKPIITLKHQAGKLLKVLEKKSEHNQKNLTLIKGLKLGEKAILEDRTISHPEAKKRMSQWLD